MQPASDYLQTVVRIATEAGAAIMTVYERAADVEIQIKDDDSPVTEADLRAHQIIAAGLQQLTPTIPVLSEESQLPEFSERRHWREYWLVDPLDGTKEFIGRNGEFTVNIALIREGEPVLGVVHVPVQCTTYCGADKQAMVINKEGAARAIGVQQLPPPTQWSDVTLRVVASRRHGGAQIASLLKRLREAAGDIEQVTMGSSLKICLLAEGKADIYPRLAPTSEWDTAAAHAVLRAAGGELVSLDFKPLRYNQKADILNPHFIAMGDVSVDWQQLLG